ncbi:hypothetical protein RP20_CCG017758 [Aedes albopictus]|nr:hypothetical protein RP20_CCG017758 [Aedes albopictus]
MQNRNGLSAREIAYKIAELSFSRHQKMNVCSIVSMLFFVVLGGLLLIQGAWSQDVPESCIAASCTTFQQINTLYCHANPARFCQCRPAVGGGWTLQVMPCPEPETMFSFRHQVCVHPSMWDDAECGPSGPGGDEDETDLENVILGCEAAPCGTYEEINTLTCHPDAKRFCQCRPVSTQEDYPNRGLFQAISMPCAQGTSFSFGLQTCAHDALWINTCP